jgi:hypothetical protein
MKFKKYVITCCLVLVVFFAKGQEKIKIQADDYTNQQIPMADMLRSEGKIYVVVATLAALMGGIVVYLILLDKRLNKAEKK